MNPSMYSTDHPIVLNITSHDLSVTHEVMTKTVTLEADKAKRALKMSIDKTSCNVPTQYYDALWLLIHHLCIYQMTARQLMEYPPLHAAQDTYTSIAYYYCEVLLAFVQEVKDSWRRNSKTWRSAHVDYHFAMAIHANAFLEPMQKETLKKINRTWDDFKKRKIYEPVVKLTIDSYHQDFCSGKNMCGVPSTGHDHSVEDMVSSIVKQSSERLAEAMKVDQTEKKTTSEPIDSTTSVSTSSHAEDNGMHEAANMADNHEDASSSTTNKPNHRQAKATHIASPRVNHKFPRANGPRDMSPVDEDAIDEAANMFQEKEDGQKRRKTRKGGRKDKDTIGSATADRQSGKGRPKRPSKSTKTKVKSQAIVISDDENIDGRATSQGMNDNTELSIGKESMAHGLPAAELQDISRNAKDVGNSMAVAEQEEEDVDGTIMTIQSSPMAMRPEAHARKSTRKGKWKAIVLSDEEGHSDHPEPPPCGQSKQNIGKRQQIHDLDDAPDMNLPAATSFEDTKFPSMFDDWEEWNHVAFDKGNSQIFLKLGAWILVRFRQLTQTPIHGAVKGLLIPDHPASFDIESEANFNEALGMTRLYSALAHIDTHPQYLAHLFHELGKASSEGRLECSHPDLRQLPEPPTPVLSMVADEPLSWLKALPFEEFVDTVDMDADGEFDDGDGDVSISMALDDMDISGVHNSVDVLDDQDAPRRKRTMSTPLSPPKDDGGRGFPKRSRASQTESFRRPSSPVVQSTSALARAKRIHSRSTQDKGVPIQVVHFVDHQSGFAFPESEGDAIIPGSKTIPDGHSIPSPPLGDHGVISDISAWTESEEESRMQISSHSEGDEVAENIDDRTDDTSGLGIVSNDDSDGRNIGHVVDKVDEETGEKMSGSRAISQSSTGHTNALDEDVRVFVPSTPE